MQQHTFKKTFKTDDGTIPSTFVMKNGKVKVQKSWFFNHIIELLNYLNKKRTHI